MIRNKILTAFMAMLMITTFVLTPDASADSPEDYDVTYGWRDSNGDGYLDVSRCLDCNVYANKDAPYYVNVNTLVNYFNLQGDEPFYLNTVKIVVWCNDNTKYDWEDACYSHQLRIGNTVIGTPSQATEHPWNDPGPNCPPESRCYQITWTDINWYIDDQITIAVYYDIPDINWYYFFPTANGNHNDWFGNGNEDDFYETYNLPEIDSSYNSAYLVSETLGYENAIALAGDYNNEEDNNQPYIPSIPTGPGVLDAGESGYYSTSATDPDDDNVKYGWDWNGDEIVDEWSCSKNSGSTDSRSHSWDIAGTYYVKVKAEDNYGYQSGFSPALTVFITEETDECTLTTHTTGCGSIDPSGGTYTKGTTITLTADPCEGYEFDYWSGDETGGTNPLQIEMDEDKTITAHFNRLATDVKYNAVIHGISDFSQWGNAEEFPDSLAGPYNVEGIKDALKSSSGNIQWNTRVKTESQVTIENIVSDIKWLAGQANENSVSLYYITTHGARDDDGEEGLALYEKDSFIFDEELAALLAGADAVTDPEDFDYFDFPGSLIVIIEACHSGGITEEIKYATEKLQSDRHVVAISSTDKENIELARKPHYMPERFRGTPFTVGLISAMRGGGKSSGNSVTIEDCFYHAESLTEAYIENLFYNYEGYTQSPTIFNSQSKDITILSGVENNGPQSPSAPSGKTDGVELDKKYEYTSVVGDPDSGYMDVYFSWGDTTFDELPSESPDQHEVECSHIWIEDSIILPDPVHVWVVAIDEEGAISWSPSIKVDSSDSKDIKQYNIITSLLKKIKQKIQEITNTENVINIVNKVTNKIVEKIQDSIDSNDPPLDNVDEETIPTPVEIDDSASSTIEKIEWHPC